MHANTANLLDCIAATHGDAAADIARRLRSQLAVEVEIVLDAFPLGDFERVNRAAERIARLGRAAIVEIQQEALHG